MKSTFLAILGFLFCHVLASSAAAQSMAEKYLNELFKPESNLQSQLAAQQSAHDRNKDLIFRMTVYPDSKDILLTGGYFVTTKGMFTEFRQGPIRGDKSGEWHLPPKAMEKLKALLAQLPAPKDPNPEKRRAIISFLDGEKWVTRIYDGSEYRIYCRPSSSSLCRTTQATAATLQTSPYPEDLTAHSNE